MITSAENNSPVVLKFGGSSVAEIKHWKTIVERLRKELRMNRNPLLVLSALKNVSNTLEDILHQAKLGNFQLALKQLVDKHIQFACSLDISVESELRRFGELLTEFCQQISQQQSITPKMHAKVLAIGELMSTTIGHAFICQSGLVAKWVDARELLRSESQPDQWHHYTSAVCAFDYCPKLAEQLFGSEPSTQVVVTQGFIASDNEGDTVLLGREGSDTTAAYLAAKIGAKEIQIWTDVTGVYSANPVEVAKARPIEKLSYAQAHSMAKLGAKVLHPKVIRPVATNNLSLSVKSTWFPDHAGTEISGSHNQVDGPLAIMLVKECTLLRLNASEITSDQLNEIQYSLAELGFDLLITHSTSTNVHMILKYVNSDKPFPLAEILAQSLHVEQQNINLTGDLLSVVGSCENLAWLTDVESAMQQYQSARESIQLVSEKEGRVSYYLNHSSGGSLINKLHDKLFPD